MSVPRVLLLLPFIPGATHAGDVFTRELLQRYPCGQLCCFAVGLRHPGTTPPATYEGFPLVWVDQPPEAGIGKFGSRAKQWHTLVVHYFLRTRLVPRLVAQAVQVGRQHQVDTVVVILNHHPTLLYVAKAVAQQLNARLLVNVHDPPKQFIEQEQLQGLARQRISRWITEALANTLRTASYVGTASVGMQLDYQSQYGIKKSVVLIHGLQAEIARPPAVCLHEENRLIIGFAGSLYAQQEWEALLAALAQVNWCIAGRRVTLRLMGGAFQLNARTHQHIEYLGWRSPPEVLDELAQVDVTYLPYWFDSIHRQAVRQCFPNKLSTYLAAGRPVFYHGPHEASPTKFFQRFPAGVCCHSLEPGIILQHLQRLVLEPNFYQCAAQQAYNAIQQELNQSVFLNRFAEFIGIPAEQLGLSQPA